MSMRTQIFAKNYGYGKLFLKTTSTDADWDLEKINTPTESEFTIYDNINNDVLKQGSFTTAYKSLNADLSLGLGDYSIYLELEAAFFITELFSYKHISWLDMNVLSSLLHLNIYNTNNPVEVLGSLEGLMIFYTKDADLIGFDFSKNYNLRNFQNVGSVTTDIPLMIDQNKNLEKIRIETNMQLASFDTTGMDSLTYLNIKYNPITSINVDNLSIISYIFLKNCNDLVSFIHTLQNNNLKYLTIWNNTSGLNSIDISLYPNLITAYLRSLSINSITVDNPKLETLYLSYNQLSDLVISNNTTAIKQLQIYGNGSLNSLTKPDLPSLNYVNIGGYNDIQEFDFSGSPLLNTLVCNHANFRKINLKNGATNLITNIVHAYYSDCCFLVDDENDPVIAGWDLRDGDVVTSDQATYDAF